MKEVMIGDEYVIEAGDELAEIDSTQGETSNEDIEGSVLKSVLQNEQKTYDKGQIIGEAFNQGIKGFESRHYWSCNEHDFLKQEAWLFDFKQGLPFKSDKRVNLYVRLCK